MNIYYFAGTKLPSQSSQSIHSMKMAEAFARAGHNVTLFAKGMHDAASEDIFKIYNIQQNFKLYLSPQIDVPILSGAKRLMNISRKIANMDKPDIVYGHDPVALSLLAPSGVPVIFEAFKMPDLSLHSWAFQRLLRQSNFRAIIVVSEILKHELLNKYPQIKSEDIFVAHNGTDLIDDIVRADQESQKLQGRTDAFKVGYAGSLKPGKGISLIPRIAALCPECDFHIFGGTQDNIEELQQQNGLDNVYYYGYRDHADMPGYIKAFDVAIAPYQHRALIRTGQNMSRWISPTKVFEYMAAKKPILCSNLPGIDEILQHEYSAFLLPATDEEKWAAAIRKLKDDAYERDRLGRNAYNTLRKYYTRDMRVQAISEFCFDQENTASLSKAS